MSSSIIAPSILSADFGNLAEDIATVAAAGADWIHMDVMDGKFVPDITFGPKVVRAVRSACDLPFDVHLMIRSPEDFLGDFREAGADSITVHAEACPHLHRTIQMVRETGARVGVSLNPHTPLGVLEHVLEDVDMILLMTVNPGWGGQAFIPGMLSKIRRLREHIQKQGLDVDIQVDGGINSGTIFEAAAAGADIFVAGSAVFKASDYAESIAGLRRLAEKGLEARGGA